MRIHMRALGMSVGILAAMGCGGGSSGGAEESSGGESSAYEGPVASTDVELGKEKFTDFCDDCHPDAQSGEGPSLIEHAHTAARIRQQIREGSDKMRPFSEARLSNENMEAILAYLASVNAVK